MEEARHCIARRNLSCSAPGRYPDQGQSYGIAEQADNCRSIEPIRSKHRLLEHPHLTENACQHEGGENCHPISSRPRPLVPMPASHRFHMRLPSDGPVFFLDAAPRLDAAPLREATRLIQASGMPISAHSCPSRTMRLSGDFVTRAWLRITLTAWTSR